MGSSAVFLCRVCCSKQGKRDNTPGTFGLGGFFFVMNDRPSTLEKNASSVLLHHE